VILSLVAGYATWHFYADRHEYTGTILHTPLPSAETSRLLLPTNDLKSLVSLVKAPESMQAVVQLEHLDISTNTLADRLDVKNPAGSPMVVVSLKWRGQGDGTAILNRVLEQFVVRAGELRRKRTEERSQDFQAALAACNIEILTSHREMEAFNRKHQLLDLPHEIRALKSDITNLRAAIALARRNENNCGAQMKVLDKTIDQLSSDREIGLNVANATTLTPDRIQRMIEEERRIHQAKARLEVKLRQRDRIKDLVKSGACSQAECDIVQADVAVLEAQVNDNNKVLELKQDLLNLDRAVKPILNQALGKKLDVDLQQLNYKSELAALETEHQSALLRMEQLLGLQKEGSPILWRVEHAEAERGRLQGQSNQLRVLQTFSGGEASVYLSASTVRAAAGREWLAPLAVSCGLLLLVILVLAGTHSEPAQPKLLPNDEIVYLTQNPRDEDTTPMHFATKHTISTDTPINTEVLR